MGVFLLKYMGQLASFLANLTAFLLQVYAPGDVPKKCEASYSAERPGYVAGSDRQGVQGAHLTPWASS